MKVSIKTFFLIYEELYNFSKNNEIFQFNIDIL